MKESQVKQFVYLILLILLLFGQLLWGSCVLGFWAFGAQDNVMRLRILHPKVTTNTM